MTDEASGSGPHPNADDQPAATDAAEARGGRPAERPLDETVSAVALRVEVAFRAQAAGLDRLLEAIVDATVTLFDAEAASIALVEPGGSLRFRAAAGPQGAGVVGTIVGAGQGIAGFVVSTGQPLAVTDVAADPRFDRDVAARTGYVPRSILAVPLAAEDRVLGVLEVLDRRGRDGFDLRDQALAGVFARQAAVAIEVTAVERDAARLVARALGELAVGADAAAVVRRALAADEPEAGAAFWAFVDRLAALAGRDEATLALLSDLAEAAAGHLRRGGSPSSRGGAVPSWRARAGLAGSDG